MRVLLLAAFGLLVGCATNYETYVEAQKSIAEANARAEEAKYKAMAAIGESGTETSKVAAMMAIALGKDTKPPVTMAPPRTAADTVLGWATVLVPALTQGYVANQNTKAIMNQADNATRVAISTNETFSAIAGNIQAPAASVTETYTYADSNNTLADSNNSAQTTTTSTVTDTYTYADSNNTLADSNNSTQTTTTSTVTDTYTDSNNAFTDSYNPIDNTDNADNSVSNAEPIVVNAAGDIAQ